VHHRAAQARARTGPRRGEQADRPPAETVRLFDVLARATTTTTTTTTTMTSAPPTLSPAAQDLKDAEQTVPRFWTVLDTLASSAAIGPRPRRRSSSLATASLQRGWEELPQGRAQP